MRLDAAVVVLAAALAGSSARSALAQEPAPPAVPVTESSVSPPGSQDPSCEWRADQSESSAPPAAVVTPYRNGDIRGALGTWHKIKRSGPTTACVRVYGAPRTDPGLIATFAGVLPGTRLTNDRLIRARRRLEQLPLSPRPLVTFAPIDASRARVDLDVDDRSPLPDGLVPIGTILVSGLATQEYTVDVASPSGHGEDLSAAIRWQQNWHRVRLGVDLPVTGAFAGLASVSAWWEHQVYAPSPGIRTTLERRSLSVGLSSWSRSWFWWHAAAGGDQMDGRTYGSVETAIETRFLRDHLAIEGTAAAWQGGAASSHFGRTLGRMSVRSTTRDNAPVWLVSAGAGRASDRSPFQTWVGAGSRTVGDAVLRAHPLVKDGAVTGLAFGRRLAFGSVEYRSAVPAHQDRSAHLGGVRGQRACLEARRRAGSHAMAGGCRPGHSPRRLGAARRGLGGSGAQSPRRPNVRVLRPRACVARAMSGRRNGAAVRSVVALCT